MDFWVQALKICGRCSVFCYSYAYDPLNRIIAATDNTNKFNLSNISYDKNGNILTLDRKGHTNIGATTFGDMDNLSYAYDNGNKLMSVTDAVNTPVLMKGEFKDGNKVGNDYSYDLNGNLKTDANKGITDITYNHKNLPVEININGVANGDIKYIYDATGLKLKKIVTEGGVQKETSYAGKYTYKNNKLEFFHTSEGYVEPKNPDDLAQGFDYIYQYVDHIGNIRLSYKNVGTSSNVDLEIQEENNYYPFGLKHKGYNTIQSAARDHTYEYNGIEYEESLGLNLMEMELRQFDPAIGRFTSLDPVIHHSMSTYTAFDNNPVFYSDPSGGDSQTIYDFGGNAWTVDCENGECGNARKQDSGTKPKYQIYNISPVGDISIKDGTDNFEILTAYGSPYPEDLDELATDRRKDLLTALQSIPKAQQISLLKKLGVSPKIIKMLTKNASKAGGLFSNTSLLGLAGIPNSLRKKVWLEFLFWAPFYLH